MELVTNKEEILDNVELFLEELESDNADIQAKAIKLIKTSNIFLAILTEEVNFFIPSLFLDKKNQSFDFSKKQTTEEESAITISQILGSTPKIDKTMDELFLDFCDEIAINRNDVGLSREYWIMKNI